MRRNGRRRAAAIGAATFLAAIGTAMLGMPTEEVEAEPPATAAELARVAQMNAEANQARAERIRREGASAL